MEKGLSDLIGSGLIAIDGDRIRLHASAHEHSAFGRRPAARRRTGKLADQKWFDLISQEHGGGPHAIGQKSD